MKKTIRRLSFGLALLICVQGLGMGMAEDVAPQESQPAVQQEQSAPASEPEPEKKQDATEAKSEDKTEEKSEDKSEEKEDKSEKKSEEKTEATTQATLEPTLEPAPEKTAETSDTPAPETTMESTMEPTTEPATEATMEPAPQESADAGASPAPETTQPSKEDVAPELHRFERTPESDVIEGTEVCFEAEFSDDVSLRKIEIYVDETLAEQESLSSAAGERITFKYETDSLSVGEHWIYVVGYDAADNKVSSREMRVLVLESQADEPEAEPDAQPSPEATNEPEIEPAPAPTVEPVCGLQAHAHGGSCFDEAGELICGIAGHTHGEGCYPPETPEAQEEDQAAEDIPTDDEIILAPRDESALWNGVKPSDERGMAIPMLFQTDYTQTVCTIRGVDRSVASSGCGATSLSMVIAYLTGNTSQNPYELFCEAVDDGRYHGSGWSHDTLNHYAQAYGLHSKWISNRSEEILEALKAGKPVIAHMSRGIFTSGGHYLVLRGVTEDGLVLMNDPNSRANCERAFPIDTLLKQAKTSSAFMVCWTDEMPEAPEPETELERVWGDVNGSGEIDINDAQLLYEMLDADEVDLQFDFNGDGNVDQADVELLVRAILNPEARMEPESNSETKAESSPESEPEANSETTPEANSEEDVQTDTQLEGGIDA